MTDPFTRSPVDGTDNSVIPLKIVDQFLLKVLAPVIALKLESPARESTYEHTVQQWALTRDQAES